LINVGRGAHLREQDLLDALADGQLSGAVLDVFETEPLPADHPFWKHERIVLTPHIGASTGFDSAAAVLIDNIQRHQRGEPMLGLVDRESGY
jgi:glyoxylate/hydroxypyruvate reductase A